MDNGFDRELPASGEWLAFASTQSPLRIWLEMTPADTFALGLSQQNVTGALGNFGKDSGETLPFGTVGARVAPNVPTPHRLIRRAFQLSKSLPVELLHGPVLPALPKFESTSRARHSFRTVRPV